VNSVDVVLLAPMVALVAFFAGVAVREWRDARAQLRTGRADAPVIRQLQPDREISSAA
jgi:hypothetical protein